MAGRVCHDAAQRFAEQQCHCIHRHRLKRPRELTDAQNNAALGLRRCSYLLNAKVPDKKPFFSCDLTKQSLTVTSGLCE